MCSMSANWLRFLSDEILGRVWIVHDYIRKISCAHAFARKLLMGWAGFSFAFALWCQIPWVSGKNVFWSHFIRHCKLVCGFEFMKKKNLMTWMPTSQAPIQRLLNAACFISSKLVRRLIDNFDILNSAISDFDEVLRISIWLRFVRWSAERIAAP